MGYAPDKGGSVLTIVHSLDYDQTYSQITPSNLAETKMGWKTESPPTFMEGNRSENNGKLVNGNNLVKQLHYSDQGTTALASLYFRPLVKPNHYISSLPNLQTQAVQNSSCNIQLSHPNIKEASCDVLSSNSSGYTASMNSLLKHSQQEAHPETSCITYSSRYKSASDCIPTSEHTTTSSGYISTSNYIRTASDYSSSLSPAGRCPPKPSETILPRSFSEEYISSRDCGDDVSMSSTNSLDDGYMFNGNIDFLTSVV